MRMISSSENDGGQLLTQMSFLLFRSCIGLLKKTLFARGNMTRRKLLYLSIISLESSFKIAWKSGYLVHFSVLFLFPVLVLVSYRFNYEMVS